MYYIMNVTGSEKSPNFFYHGEKFTNLKDATERLHNIKKGINGNISHSPQLKKALADQMWLMKKIE